MELTDEQLEELHEACEKVVDFLNKYCNPHNAVLITQYSAQLLSAEYGFPYKPLN